MAFLSRIDVLTKTDLPRRTVSVPEWGGEVLIRTLRADERDGYEVWRGKILADHEDRESPVTVRAALVSLACCDERGEALFSRDDVESLAKLSAAALDRVYDAAICLNAMDRESQEDIRKNSKAPPAGGGCTAKQPS